MASEAVKPINKKRLFLFSASAFVVFLVFMNSNY
jgi:hypothetical protein